MQLERLLGTRIAVGNAELRFPLLYGGLAFLPSGFPPIEGALFYDVGVAWDDASTVKWHRDSGDDPLNVRTPSQTFGAGARMNLFRHHDPAGRLLDSAGAVGIQGLLDPEPGSGLLGGAGRRYDGAAVGSGQA